MDAAPLLLIHGFAQTADSWEEVARLKGWPFFRVPLFGFEGALEALPNASGEPFAIAVDVPGNAQRVAAASRGPLKSATAPDATPQLNPAHFQLDAAAAQLRALARALEKAAGNAPVTVGYSQGGRLLLHALATQQPAAGDQLPLSACVLESAGLGPETDGQRAAFAQRSQQWAARARTQGTELFMDWWAGLPLFASQRQLPPERQQLLRKGRLSHTPEELAFSLEGMGQHRQAAKAETLAALEQLMEGSGVPVTYIAGALDEKYSAIGRNLAQRFADQPLFSLRSIPGAGHNTHFEQPARFADACQK